MCLHKYIFKVSGRAEYTTRHRATSAGEGCMKDARGNRNRSRKSSDAGAVGWIIE